MFSENEKESKSISFSELFILPVLMLGHAKTNLSLFSFSCHRSLCHTKLKINKQIGNVMCSTIFFFIM